MKAACRAFLTSFPGENPVLSKWSKCSEKDSGEMVFVFYGGEE